jgi:hypothetical protein
LYDLGGKVVLRHAITGSRASTKSARSDPAWTRWPSVSGGGTPDAGGLGGARLL